MWWNQVFCTSFNKKEKFTHKNIFFGSSFYESKRKKKPFFLLTPKLLIKEKKIEFFVLIGEKNAFESSASRRANQDGFNPGAIEDCKFHFHFKSIVGKLIGLE